MIFYFFIKELKDMIKNNQPSLFHIPTCTSSDDVNSLVTSALLEIMCSGKNSCITQE